MNFNRIEIDGAVPPATPVQLLIPVKTIVNQINVKIFAAGLIKDTTHYPDNPNLC